MDKKLPEDSIGAWARGEISDEELRSLVSEEELRQYKAILAEAETWQVPAMNKEAAMAEIRAKRTQSKEETPVVSINRRRKLIGRIAAAVLFLAVGTWVLLPENTSVVSFATNHGETLEVLLPDSSVITLNANSEISYDANQYAEARTINLKGCAHFDVMPGADFDVAFAQGQVHVLGTHFDIREAADFFSVRCFEGKVQVSAEGSNDKSILTAGQASHFKQGSGWSNFDHTLSDPDWKSGFTRFTESPLPLVIRALEDTYGLTIDATQIDLNRSVNSRIPNGNLDLALEVIFDPLGLNYEMTGKDLKLTEGN